MLGETDAFVLLYYQCVVQAGGEEGGKNTRETLHEEKKKGTRYWRTTPGN